MSRYAFIVPRFGEGLGGGAETLVGTVARALHERGDEIVVCTTCAKDNRTWANEFAAGVDQAFGVPVLRFSVDTRNLDVWVPLQTRISEGLQLSIDEQLTWMRESVNSQGLYAYIAAHGREFDALFFAPYLFGTTFWGSLIQPERAVLIPCLHDEAYAYLEVIGSMFRQVRGCLFNARPEQQLAQQLYGSVVGAEVGMGFDPLDGEAYASLSPLPHVPSPYLLYVGRKETGKNAHLLVDYFVSAKDQGLLPEHVRLVIAGGGSFDDLHRPKAQGRSDIIDLSHTSEEEKLRLMRHALLLVQPSVNESFSIVIMESWLVGTPVVVHAHCAVTRDHVVRSGGGLYFANESDFVGIVREFIKRPQLRDALAASGRRYVLTQYAWPAVLRRFDEAMTTIMSAHPRPGQEAKTDG